MSARDRLDEIQQRADAATEGPWHEDHDSEEVFADTCVHIGDYGWVASGPKGQGPHYDEDTAQGRADAEFIAHARQDVPWLLSEVRRLRDGIEREAEALAALAKQAEGLDFDPEQRARGVAYRLAERSLRAITDALGGEQA